MKFIRLKLFCFFVLSLSLYSCIPKEKHSVRIENELRASFEKASRQNLLIFLDKWYNFSSRIDKGQITSDSLNKELTEIFKVIYTPLNFKQFGWQGWGDRSFFSESKYFVIQDFLPYKKVNEVDTLISDYLFQDTLRNFTPHVDAVVQKTLFLVDPYKSAVRNFLMDNVDSVGLFIRKLNFLKRELTIPPG